MTRAEVVMWLQERAENAARIAATKTGDDRAGWLEDEAYFLAAIRLSNTPALPKKAPLGLLVSMAIRYDHGLGVPGYYDQQMLAGMDGITHAQRFASTLRTMRQIYEEVSGNGFYSPEREADYAAQAPKEFLHE